MINFAFGTISDAHEKQGNVMLHGSGQAIRQAILQAKPWQRYVIAGAMIAGGAGWVVLGHVHGALLSAAGGVLLWRMLQYRHRALHGGRSARGTSDSEGSGEVPVDSP